MELIDYFKYGKLLAHSYVNEMACKLVELLSKHLKSSSKPSDRELQLCLTLSKSSLNKPHITMSSMKITSNR